MAKKVVPYLKVWHCFLQFWPFIFEHSEFSDTVKLGHFFKAPYAQKDGHSTWPFGGIIKISLVKSRFCVWATIPLEEAMPYFNTCGAPYKKT